MRLKTKKIIARELLIIISSLVLVFVFNIGIFLYNRIIESDLKTISQEIVTKENQIKTLILPIKEKTDKQNELYQEIKKKGLQGKHNSSIQFWDRLSQLYKVDSIIYRWNNRWSPELKTTLKEIGFKDGIEFNDFVSHHYFTDKDENIKNQALEIQGNIDLLTIDLLNSSEKIIKPYRQSELSNGILLMLSILLFPFRFLIYTIIWSVRTLKEKESN